MTAWWHEQDRVAFQSLRDAGACYSDTEDLGNAVAAFGEHLVHRSVGGVRLRQASGEGDIRLPNGRIVEVKTTSQERQGWNLGYAPEGWPKTDYALVRVDLSDWRVTEAWLVPARVAKAHAHGPRYRMSPRGPWREKAKKLSLNRY